MNWWTKSHKDVNMWHNVNRREVWWDIREFKDILLKGCGKRGQYVYERKSI